MAYYGSWRSVPLPSDWESVIRPMVLARDPICMWGLIKGEIGECNSPSTEVDHMGPPMVHEIETLRGICTLHHRIRTASQGVAGRARIRSERPKQRPVPRHPGIKEGPA